MSETWPDGFVAKVDAEHRAELEALAADNDAMSRRFMAKCAAFDAQVAELERLNRELAEAKRPVPMLIHCPMCKTKHIDVGDFATKVHHTHSCQTCGHTWRPAVVATVGVEFLPGFKNAAPPPAESTPVQPAPQPAPSGDEAKVREIVLRWEPRSPADCSVAIKCAVREAYAAGKADAMEQCKAADYLAESLRDPNMRKIFMEEWKRDNAWLEGAQEERLACEKLARDRAARHNWDGHDRRKVSLPRFKYAEDEARAIADAIARRGSEGT